MVSDQALGSDMNISVVEQAIRRLGSNIAIHLDI